MVLVNEHSNTINLFQRFFSFVDVFFLNREPLRRVKNSEELIPVFAVPPAGMQLDLLDSCHSIDCC